MFPDDVFVDEEELAEVALPDEPAELEEELAVGVGLDVFPAELEEELDEDGALLDPGELVAVEPSQLGVGLDTFPAEEIGSRGRLELVELVLSSTGSATCLTVVAA